MLELDALTFGFESFLVDFFVLFSASLLTTTT